MAILDILEELYHQLLLALPVSYQHQAGIGINPNLVMLSINTFLNLIILLTILANNLGIEHLMQGEPGQLEELSLFLSQLLGEYLYGYNEVLPVAPWLNLCQHLIGGGGRYNRGSRKV